MSCIPCPLSNLGCFCSYLLLDAPPPSRLWQLPVVDFCAWSSFLFVVFRSSLVVMSWITFPFAILRLAIPLPGRVSSFFWRLFCRMESIMTFFSIPLHQHCFPLHLVIEFPFSSALPIRVFGSAYPPCFLFSKCVFFPRLLSHKRPRL